jgi:hypothetical protein
MVGFEKRRGRDAGHLTVFECFGKEDARMCVMRREGQWILGGYLYTDTMLR